MERARYQIVILSFRGRCSRELPQKGTGTEQEPITLSKDKWQWMAERNVEALDKLFAGEAVFVHMGGTMTKSQELDTIKSGRIQYKDAQILASLSFTRLMTP